MRLVYSVFKQQPNRTYSNRKSEEEIKAKKRGRFQKHEPPTFTLSIAGLTAKMFQR